MKNGDLSVTFISTSNWLRILLKRIYSGVPWQLFGVQLGRIRMHNPKRSSAVAHFWLLASITISFNVLRSGY